MSITNHGNLAEDAQSLLVSGNGDGGGGPLAGMLERAKRFEALSDEVGGVQRMAIGITHSLDQFYEGIEERTEHGKNLVTWHGELYLEFHRGTYTSQPKTKLSNRKAEIFLREIEHVNTLAFFLGRHEYPTSVLDEMWEDVLLCQFHDVLPGSSIEMIYEDSAVMYADVMAKGQKIYDAALKTLGFGGEKKSVLNTLTWPRSEVIRVDYISGFANAQQSNVRQSRNGGFAAVAPDGLGVTKVADLQYTPATVEEKEDGAYIPRNENLQVIIKGGAIVSLIDRSLDKELVPEGAQSNRLVLFDDQPLYWDAWDVEVHHLEKFDHLEPSQVTILDKGLSAPR
jgi:alpha-mannosidase